MSWLELLDTDDDWWVEILEAAVVKPLATDPTTARPMMTQMPYFKNLSKLILSKRLKIDFKPRTLWLLATAFWALASLISASVFFFGAGAAACWSFALVPLAA